MIMEPGRITNLRNRTHRGVAGFTLLAFLLTLAQPFSAFALRQNQLETQEKRSGLEEALREDNPQLAQLTASVPSATPDQLPTQSTALPTVPQTQLVGMEELPVEKWKPGDLIRKKSGSRVYGKVVSNNTEQGLLTVDFLVEQSGASMGKMSVSWREAREHWEFVRQEESRQPTDERAQLGTREILIEIRERVPAGPAWSTELANSLHEEIVYPIEGRFWTLVGQKQIPLVPIGPKGDAISITLPGRERSGYIFLLDVFDNSLRAIADRAQLGKEWREGQLELVVRREEDALILELSDNGIGVRKADLERKVFRKQFTRARGERPGGDGRGFLLSYGMKLVEASGGTLEIISRRLGSPSKGWYLTYNPLGDEPFKLGMADRDKVGTTVRWRFPGIFGTPNIAVHTAGMEELAVLIRNAIREFVEGERSISLSDHPDLTYYSPFSKGQVDFERYLEGWFKEFGDDELIQILTELLTWMEREIGIDNMLDYWIHQEPGGMGERFLLAMMEMAIFSKRSGPAAIQRVKNWIFGNALSKDFLKSAFEVDPWTFSEMVSEAADVNSPEEMWNLYRHVIVRKEPTTLQAKVRPLRLLIAWFVYQIPLLPPGSATLGEFMKEMRDHLSRLLPHLVDRIVSALEADGSPQARLWAERIKPQAWHDSQQVEAMIRWVEEHSFPVRIKDLEEFFGKFMDEGLKAHTHWPPYFFVQTPEMVATLEVLLDPQSRQAVERALLAPDDEGQPHPDALEGRWAIELIPEIQLPQSYPRRRSPYGDVLFYRSLPTDFRNRFDSYRAYLEALYAGRLDFYSNRMGEVWTWPPSKANLGTGLEETGDEDIQQAREEPGRFSGRHRETLEFLWSSRRPGEVIAPTDYFEGLPVLLREATGLREGKLWWIPKGPVAPEALQERPRLKVFIQPGQDAIRTQLRFSENLWLEEVTNPETPGALLIGDAGFRKIVEGQLGHLEQFFLQIGPGSVRQVNAEFLAQLLTQRLLQAGRIFHLDLGEFIGEGFQVEEGTAIAA